MLATFSPSTDCTLNQNNYQNSSKWSLAEKPPYLILFFLLLFSQSSHLSENHLKRNIHVLSFNWMLFFHLSHLNDIPCEMWTQKFIFLFVTSNVFMKYHYVSPRYEIKRLCYNMNQPLSFRSFCYHTLARFTLKTP